MKEKIIKALKNNIQSFVSGEQLSKDLNVSRMSVNKNITKLKQEGYVIEGVSQKGYRLMDDCQVYNEIELKEDLRTKIVGRNLLFFKEIDSTNTYIKKTAQDTELPDGTAVIADMQTSGKGRLGRNWVSSPEKGIWMSVLLRPDILPQEVQIITLAAAVAVVKALKKSMNINAGIKWPNDIILDNRKVCGILTEMSAEADRINYVVLGMGVNVNHNTEDFNGGLEDKAISIKDYLGSPRNIDRKGIAKAMLHELDQVYQHIKNRAFDSIIKEWKESSVTLNRPVQLVKNDECRIGQALDILPDGRLVVELEDGTVEHVISGEISVRGIMGYI